MLSYGTRMQNRTCHQRKAKALLYVSLATAPSSAHIIYNPSKEAQRSALLTNKGRNPHTMSKELPHAFAHSLFPPGSPSPPTLLTPCQIGASHRFVGLLNAAFDSVTVR